MYYLPKNYIERLKDYGFVDTKCNYTVVHIVNRLKDRPELNELFLTIEDYIK